MSEVRSLTSLMQKLAVHDERSSTLMEIKSFVAALPLSALKNVLKASDLLALFDCMNTENKEQIEITCFILSTLLPIVDPNDVIFHLSTSLQDGLKHPSHHVQQLALKELNHIIATVDGARALSESSEIIRTVMNLVGDDDESIALTAVKFLSEFGRISPNAARLMLVPGPNLATLKQVMAKNSVVRYRVYEIICNVQSESQEMLDLCVATGIIGHLVDELAGNDVLSKVTCCATLAEMASARHSLDYLIQSGVVSRMTELLKNTQNDPLSDLYVPGVIKFFGNLCVYGAPKTIVDVYPVFYDVLFTLLKDPEMTKKQVAFETIGLIGGTADGKRLLHEQGSKCTEAVKEICHMVRHGSQDLRVRAIQAMCQLLSHKKVDNDEESEEIDQITVHWFQLISREPIDAVIALCKQPFNEIRCAGFDLLKAIAENKWGMEALVEYAVVTEFLLDRSTETSKEGKEAKYTVVQTIARSPICASTFGNQNYLRFRHFVNEGPFYVESALNVAIEDA